MMSKRLGFYLLCIVFISLGIRGVLLSQLHHSNLFSGIVLQQGMLAKSLVEGDGLINQSANIVNRIHDQQVAEKRLIDIEEFRSALSPTVPPDPHITDMPGYAFLLAATWKITGRYNYLYLQIMQIVIDSLFSLLMFYVGKRFFSVSIGLIAALLFAIYLPEARLSVTALRDVWTSFTVIIVLAIVAKFWDEPKILSTAVSIGIAVGLGTWISAPSFLLPVFWGVAEVFHRGAKRAAFGAFLAMAMVLVILSPWIVRNYELYDRFLPTRTGAFWQSMWEGFGEFDNPFGAVLSDDRTYNQMKSEGYRGGYGTPQYEDFIRPKVLAAIRSDPLWYVTAVLRRIPRVISVPPDWGVTFPLPQEIVQFREQTGLRIRDYIAMHPYSLVRLFPNLVVPLLSVIVSISLWLVSLVAFWVFRQRWQTSVMLWVVALYSWAVYIPIHIEARYFIPGTLPCLIFSASVFNLIGGKVIQRMKSTKVLS